MRPDILSSQLHMHTPPALFPGMLIAFLAGSMAMWREQAWCGVVLSLLVVAILLRMPESPVYLVRSG